MVKQKENKNKKGGKSSTDEKTNTKQPHKYSENNDSKKFICLYCTNNKVFYDKSSLNRQYRRKHKEKLEICKFCLKDFYSLSSHEKKCIIRHKKQIKEISSKNNLDINKVDVNNNKTELKGDDDLSKNPDSENIKNINNKNINNDNKIDYSLKIIKGINFKIESVIEDNDKKIQ